MWGVRRREECAGGRGKGRDGRERAGRRGVGVLRAPPPRLSRGALPDAQAAADRPRSSSSSSSSLSRLNEPAKSETSLEPSLQREGRPPVDAKNSSPRSSPPMRAPWKSYLEGVMM